MLYGLKGQTVVWGQGKGNGGSGRKGIPYRGNGTCEDGWDGNVECQGRKRKIAADWDDVHTAVIRNLPFILGPRWCCLEGTKQGTDVMRNGIF